VTSAVFPDQLSMLQAVGGDCPQPSSGFAGSSKKEISCGIGYQGGYLQQESNRKLKVCARWRRESMPSGMPDRVCRTIATKQLQV
jgi:hypothetical protein